MVNAKIHSNTTLFPDLETKIRVRIRPTRRKEYLSRNPNSFSDEERIVIIDGCCHIGFT